MRSFLFPIALPVLAVAMLLPVHADAQKPHAERPTYQVGDRWIRSDGVYDLVRIEKGLYVFAAEGGREIHLTKDLAIVHIGRRGEVDWELYPAPRLKWPLVVGDWGQEWVTLRAPAWPVRSVMSTLVSFETPRPVRLTWEIAEYGKVETPGGTFGAFKITQSFAVAGATLGSISVWYAPEVRQLVRAEGPVLNFQVVAIDPSETGTSTLARTKGPATTAPLSATVSPPRSKASEPTPDATKSPMTSLEVGPAPPFVVSVSAPADQAKVEQETVELAVSASGGKGVQRVVVTLNGAEVARQEEQIAVASKAVNVPLKLREGPNTVVVIATDAAGASQQAARTIHYQKISPLGVAVRYPADGLQVYEASSVVAAVITSSKGVASVSVSLNGAEMHGEVERTPQQSVTIAVPVTLREGANTLVVKAAEPDGTIRQEKRTVSFSRPQVAGPAPGAALPLSPLQTRWAVVIGIGKYESQDIPGLRYTVADAESIYQTLIGRAGFQKDHVLLLTDKTERKPTLRNIRWALGTFLSRSAQRDDTVLIFFAGHGAPEIDPRGLERDGLAKYLIPADADPDDLYSSALPMDELQTIFGRIEAERVVAFLDACYSGAAGGRTFQSKKTRSGQVDDLFLDRLTRSKGRAIITASRPSEVSIELSALGHGLFSYYLVEGLNGAGDLNHDGIVTIQELYEYLEQQVTQKSRPPQVTSRN